MKPVERIALAAVLAILSAAAFFTSRLPLAGDAPDLPVVMSPALPSAEMLPAVATASDEQTSNEAGDAFTDLYGNEINDAIATYTFDQSGSLYELHSPQTELLRLGSPKS